MVFVPESDRRKEDIDQVEPDHPLLPLVLQCLKDRDSERPLAREICFQLTALKGEPRYTESVRNRVAEVQRLQLELNECRTELRANTEEYAANLHSKDLIISDTRSLIAMKDARLRREREEYRNLLDRKEEVLDEIHTALQSKEATLTRKEHNYQNELKVKENKIDECYAQVQWNRTVLEQERKEHQLQLDAKERQIAIHHAEKHKIKVQNYRDLEVKERIIERMHRDISRRLHVEEEQRRELEWNLHLARRQLDGDRSVRRRLPNEPNLTRAQDKSNDMPDLAEADKSTLVDPPEDTSLQVG